MISVLAVKEIRENLLSLKFYLIIVVSIGLVLTSIILMTRDYKARLADFELLKPDEVQARAIIPPSPLSILVRGMDEEISTAYEIVFGGQIEVGSSQQSVNEVFRLFSTPDLLHIVRIVFSLAAMLFAFDRLSGEKESRTLALLLSGPCGRTSCIVGKWLGGLISFFVPLILTLILGLLVIWLSGRIGLSGTDLIRLAMVAGIAGLYLAFFFTLGLLVSARTASPSTSLVVSLFLWVFLVFIIPGVGNSAARTVRPLPTTGQIEMRRYHVWVREVFDRISRQSSDNFSIKDRVELTQAINRGNQEITDSYRPKLVARSGLAANISRLSPAGSLVLATTDLAGTGRKEIIRLVDEVVRYKNRVFAANPLHHVDWRTGKPIPNFSYWRASPGEAFTRGAWLDIVLLTAWLLIGFSLAYIGFMRVDIR